MNLKCVNHRPAGEENKIKLALDFTHSSELRGALTSWRVRIPNLVGGRFMPSGHPSWVSAEGISA
jgi:hypothetical protein